MWAASSSTTRSGGSRGFPAAGRLRERLGEDLLGQRAEIPAQPTLVVGGRAEVERVTAAEQIGRVEGVARTVAGIGERSQDRLRRGVHRAAGALVATPRRPGRVQRFRHSCLFENEGHLAGLLRVDPSHHIGHRPTVARGGEEERCQQFRRGGVPELAVGGGAVGLGRLRQIGRRPSRPGPLHARGERRPRTRAHPGGTGRIDAPDAAAFVAPIPGVPQEVALHAGRHHRAFPGQDRRHGQGGGLPALRRPDHHDRLRRARRRPGPAARRRGPCPGPGDPGCAAR